MTMQALTGDTLEFFAPVSSDMVDGLVGRYRNERDQIIKAAEAVRESASGVFHYFVEGTKKTAGDLRSVTSLFDPEAATKALNSHYWKQALELTDVIECMPQKRRDEWWNQIHEHKTPDFEEDTVRTTIQDLLVMRSQFFAERVDGCFRVLSGKHVTNRPEGFGKRMIIGGVIDSWNFPDYSRAGYITDLRSVVAKFMGRNQPHHNSGSELIKAAARNPGQWMLVDGGAFKIRVYTGVGTAHIEVHPDMAWRLNSVLASLYPSAIPPKFRQEPKRKPKQHQLIQRPLPFEVLSILARLEQALKANPGYRNGCTRIKNTLRIPFGTEADKPIIKEVLQVLDSIGGARVDDYHIFDYDPQPVIDMIVCSGCIPDDKTHQFYPTPEHLAQVVADLAEIEPHHSCLEPSAGTGALIDKLPECQHLTCIEISELRAEVLRNKGNYTITGDFLKAAELTHGQLFDRVVMNPPFSQGRWLDHLEAAAHCTAKGGRIVAILPSGAQNKNILPGWSCVFHGPYDNEFAGASVSVVILVAEKP